MHVDITGWLRDHPGFDHFPVPEELDQDLQKLHPAAVSEVGKSALGAPIRMLTVGSGKRHALIFAGPHPNEPIGFLTVRMLAEVLCGEPALTDGWTWHLVGCVDPDGARLNEGWYRGPFTRRNYARHLYRPPLHEQVEWTFPDPDGPPGLGALPETRALQRLIDDIRPNLLCSLHNRELGGMFYYITHDLPGLADELVAITRDAGIPLHAGDAELPDARRIRPGVFAVPTAQRVRDVLGDVEDDTSRFGTSSLHYAARHGTVSLVVEVPMWPDRRGADESACGRRLADVLTDVGAALVEVPSAIGARFDPLLESFVVRHARFDASLADLRRTAGGLAAALREQASRTQHTDASVADEFDLIQTVHMFRLRGVGTAMRMIDAELAAGNVTPAILTAQRDLGVLFETWADKADEHAVGEDMPLRDLAVVQLRAILAAAATVGSD